MLYFLQKGERPRHHSPSHTDSVLYIATPGGIYYMAIHGIIFQKIMHHIFRSGGNRC